MENSCRKKYKQSPKKWISASSYPEFRRHLRLIPANAGLFHYAGNNPVRYIDPDGRLQVLSTGGYNFRAELNDDKKVKVYPFVGNSGNDFFIYKGYLLANDGKTKIYAYYKLNREYSSQDNFDCHGLTFTNGTFWINNGEIEKLLMGDGYLGKETLVPEKGDIMVQRYSNGKIYHSATVLKYDKKNNAVYVKEAMGAKRFKFRDGKFYDVNYQWYVIDPSRDTFYKHQENVIIEEKNEE